MTKYDLSRYERDDFASACANGYFLSVVALLSVLLGSILPLVAVPAVVLLTGRASIYRRKDGGAA